MSYAYQPAPDHKNLLIAIALSCVLLFGWQYFVELPRKREMAAQAQTQAARQEAERAQVAVKERAEGRQLSREESLAESPRLKIMSDTLHGSLALKGLRFDDLTLAHYRVDISPESPEVILLAPRSSAAAYFMELGWVADDAAIKVPDAQTLWQADATELTPGNTVNLRYDNGQGIIFQARLTLDSKSMFTVIQTVQNTTSTALRIRPYGLINRSYVDNAQHNYISHEGPLGVLDGSLKEISYKELREKGGQSFEHSKGWLGVTDKYWLTALIPTPGTEFKANYQNYTTGAQSRYQIDYLGEALEIAPQSSGSSDVRVFAGAKEIEVLDAYTEGKTGAAPVPLFDRAVDFGALYFLTKPIFLLLQFFHKLVGNFGIAIMLLTLLIKAIMFPLANKGYHSMASMRRLQPEMQRLKEQHPEDKMKFNQELMALYKKEKVNPASGCLPLVIQMPVFFALYKVLFVTIEMRHAPLAGWIVDLSAPDPSNIFTLFGLLHYTPPSFLHIGILPMIMAVTMWLQMKSQPTPSDPVQAKVMSYMPWFFLIFAAKFPAGLVLYWAWSNTLTVIQQQVIKRRHK